ncbi:hypothetical protein [Marinobacter sp. DUT-1]|uniref:hypothetical protein n=1 Tax=Marinobacter sp. DUT-1 TaxID=3412037 RepID=UPI003D182CCA
MKLSVRSWYSGVLCLCLSSLASAESEPVFALCAPYVEKSLVGEPAAQGGWPVYIGLTEAGAESFQAFTRENAGKTIRIEAGARQFARFTIWMPLDSRRLGGHFVSREEALAWQRILEDDLPSGPCGVT